MQTQTLSAPEAVQHGSLDPRAQTLPTMSLHWGSPSHAGGVVGHAMNVPLHVTPELSWAEQTVVPDGQLTEPVAQAAVQVDSSCETPSTPSTAITSSADGAPQPMATATSIPSAAPMKYLVDMVPPWGGCNPITRAVLLAILEIQE
ncbi:hypothetical protein MFU01_31100 [Myxococcus fulvus]|uniref:Uncharacterized protein n=1 Tax=Myxococcus fulvus TaxID=33 RepID=A0A511T377_MYXFU|nr:hypothetical protein MFU01_31100 [Myxococcus fulvus]